MPGDETSRGGDAAGIGRREPSPGFRPPMLATLVDRAPGGDGWWYERKYDGIRLIAVRSRGEVKLWTRNRLARNDSYPELVDALATQPHGRFVIDGEVVAFDGDQTSFAMLQRRAGVHGARMAAASGVEVFFYAFDLLHLDGVDVRAAPLERRAGLLAEAFEFDDPLRLSTHRTGDADALLADACRHGWEGLIAKQVRSTYEATRSRAWLKLKCVRNQEMVIGGWTDPKGSRSGLGALLIGYYDRDQRLVFAGKVGTGFDAGTLEDLQAELAPLERETSPFDEGSPRGRDLHWATPKLVCQVGFTEWTTAGRLRHPRYLGLRDDKSASDVVREAPK